jgi:hypothetical protein
MEENQNPQAVAICYTWECKEILELDYGGTKVVVLLCSWVQPRTHGPHAKNEHGYTFVNLKKLLLV